MEASRSTSESEVRSNSALIIEPTSEHTHTFILLHGLGSNGPKFGSELMETGVSSSGKTLREIFPGARFIFPTSKRRRSSAFRRAKLTQWFDIASLDDPSYRNYTQQKGLEESFREILTIVNDEAAKISRSRIILGGLSQGCAMSLICFLAFGSRVGGFLGMSGWMPFRKDMEDFLELKADKNSDDIPEKDDLFEATDENDGGSFTPLERVIKYARELVSFEERNWEAGKLDMKTTPVFLGHGADDEKIKQSLGEDICRVLNSLGFSVDWRSYLDQGHWYKIPDEIDDIVAFVRTRVR